MNMENGVVLNGQNHGSAAKSKVKKAAKKEIRRPGELQAEIGRLLAKKPDLTAQEAATRIGISRENARMAMRRFNGKLAKSKQIKEKKMKTKKDVLISKGSALAKLVGAREEKWPKEKLSMRTQNETVFVGFVMLLGISRAEELVAEERVRIARLLAGGAQ